MSNGQISGTFTGNVQWTVPVTDTTPPVVTVPADMTVQATSPGGAVVTYVASASDAGGLASFTCTPASGSTFPVGSTQVTCTATDIAGNTATKTFTVTVTPPPDTTPPVITVPADMTVQATNPGGAVVTYVVSATDAEDGQVTPTCSPASGFYIPSG